MGRLTADLIARSPTFLNTLRQRELELRGNKIPVIENLGATEDQYDAIDLSDNEIRKLENFPQLRRLQTLLLSNNRIARIAPKLHEQLPNLETLVLTNNQLSQLSDLDPLADVDASLRYLSLLDNPITKRPHYRAYVIRKLPHLRVLDFKKVKKQEREAAEKLFAGDTGAKLQKELARTYVPGEIDLAQTQKHAEQIRANIQQAIRNAKSVDDIAQLEQALATGKLPANLQHLVLPAAGASTSSAATGASSSASAPMDI